MSSYEPGRSPSFVAFFGFFCSSAYSSLIRATFSSSETVMTAAVEKREAENKQGVLHNLEKRLGLPASVGSATVDHRRVAAGIATR
jgi:hypothetical protein